jgi:pimeloyl-ACP methyl ester carboxylesterase
MTGGVRVEPFTIAVEDAVLIDLRARIRRTRWPRPTFARGWEQGADQAYLRSLLDTWAEGFDWRAHEEKLNRLSHFRATVDGLGIHFVHGRGVAPSPFPIVLTHGFPSSFLEHLDLMARLTDPVAHGGSAEDAFDVVVMSLPGYGFSDAPATALTEARTGEIWHRIMRDGLGYERFGAHGSDVGSGPTIHLGLDHPESVAGIHLSAFYLDAPPDASLEVREFIERNQRERRADVAYSRMQRTRPQTVAIGLADSPAGLAAWMLDIFRSFSDCGGELESRFRREQLLTNLTLYWATGCIGSAMRGYYDYEQFEPEWPADTTVDVPAGFAVFADSYRPGLARPPRSLAKHAFNVTRWREMPRGGHFAALEEPELLAHEIVEFFRPLRGTGQRDKPAGGSCG